MPPVHIQKINHDLNKPLLHMKSTFNEKVREQFSLIACNLTIASNLWGIEHNNLATIWREKLKGVMSCSRAFNL